MKAVLISIQPKWCELIASGKKTVEVRKTRPKIETPFKCYIYCTHSKNGIAYCKGNEILNGKVIGEFVCDEIYPIIVHPNGAVQNWNWYGLSKSCLTLDNVAEYIGANKTGYGWHISDLVIYDKPKELSAFSTIKKCNACKDSGYEASACIYDEDCRVPAIITRPPQSWCYVEA